MDPVPVAPGSLFQFRVIFLKCRREEGRSSLEGVRAGWWGLENKENEWNCYMCVCVCVPFHPPHLFPSIPSLPDQIQKAKRSVKMQKAIIRPSEYTNATYDGWVWDLERPPVKHQLFPLHKWPSLFLTCLLYQNHIGPPVEISGRHL